MRGSAGPVRGRARQQRHQGLRQLREGVDDGCARACRGHARALGRSQRDSEQHRESTKRLLELTRSVLLPGSVQLQPDVELDRHRPFQPGESVRELTASVCRSAAETGRGDRGRWLQVGRHHDAGAYRGLNCGPGPGYTMLTRATRRASPARHSGDLRLPEGNGQRRAGDRRRSPS